MTGKIEASDSADAYRVGYGKPPLDTRFRPGVSGNPRGRPKGSRNLASIVATTLGERLTITENGNRKRITKAEAAVKQLVNSAAGGDLKAIQVLLGLVQANEARSSTTDLSQPAHADLSVLKELERRLKESKQ